MKIRWRDVQHEAPPVDSDSVEANVNVYCIERFWLEGAVKRLAPHADGEYYATDLLAMAREEGGPVEAVAMDDPRELAPTAQPICWRQLKSPLLTAVWGVCR